MYLLSGKEEGDKSGRDNDKNIRGGYRLMSEE